MFWTALLVSAIVNLVCQFGVANRIRGAFAGFVLSLVIATLILMQSGHWVFGDPSYYGIVAAAAFAATLAVCLSRACIRRKPS